MAYWECAFSCLIDRDFARLQDREPSEIDTEFERHYVDHATNLQLRSTQAEEDAKSLKQLCESLDLDLESMLYTVPPERPFEQQQSPVPSVTASIEGKPLAQVTDPLTSTSPLQHTSRADDDEEIEHWLENVSDDGPINSQLHQTTQAQERKVGLSSLTHSAPASLA